MEIINLTPNQGTLTGNLYDIGSVVKKGSKSFAILLKGKTHKSHRAGCGSCTKVAALQKEDGVELQITYTALDSKGRITKSITETFSDDSIQVIKFTARVI